MFIVERTIGVAVYITLLLTVCVLISKSSRRSSYRLLSAYLVGISILAFLYVPYLTADLYRLIEYMNTYAGMPESEFMQVLSEANAPVTMIYYRVLGSMHTPGLLAGVTTFIVFWNLFYIIKDTSKRIKARGSSIALGLFTLMSTGLFMQTVGNIRTMLAFSIIARAFYSETATKRSVYKNLILYLIACLIHPAAIVATALRFIALLFVRIKDRKIRSILTGTFFWAVFLTAVIGLGFGVNIIDNVFEKADGYINEVTYTYIWDNIISLLTIAVIIISWRLSRPKEDSPNMAAWRSIRVMSVLLTLFALASFIEHATFVRFTQLNLMISLPLVIAAAQARPFKEYQEGTLSMLARALLIIPISILIISATRGALSSLKFFIL